MADVVAKSMIGTKEKKKLKSTDSMTSRERKRIQWWAKKKEAAKKEKEASAGGPPTKRKKTEDEEDASGLQRLCESNDDSVTVETRLSPAAPSQHSNPAKSGKQKKTKVKKKKAADKDLDVEEEKLHSDSAENRTDNSDGEEGGELHGDPGSKKKKKRYILFIGNLPFDVTEGDVRKHFQRAGVITHIRLLTSKETGKPRGCGYIEMASHNAHRRAVQMHETEMRGRKINVEFTSAGRKTEKRSEHLRNKNQKLAKFKFPQHPAMPTRVKKPAGPGMYRESK